MAESETGNPYTDEAVKKARKDIANHRGNIERSDQIIEKATAVLKTLGVPEEAPEEKAASSGRPPRPARKQPAAKSD